MDDLELRISSSVRARKRLRREESGGEFPDAPGQSKCESAKPMKPATPRAGFGGS
jgi:hypothetical protein